MIDTYTNVTSSTAFTRCNWAHPLEVSNKANNQRMNPSSGLGVSYVLFIYLLLYSVL